MPTSCGKSVLRALISYLEPPAGASNLSTAENGMHTLTSWRGMDASQGLMGTGKALEGHKVLAGCSMHSTERRARVLHLCI